MVILHITSVTNPKANGVAVAVKSYFEFEKDIVNVGIYNLESNLVNDVNSFSYDTYKSISSLPNGFDKPDLVVFNEVYKYKYISLYKECKKNHIKFVIIPHGCLSKSSQKKHKLKKTIANYLLFKKFIKNSSAVQFLNDEERKECIYKINKYIISGNGVDKPKYLNCCSNNNKNFVYIGRYDTYHKGLDLIVQVCSKYKKWFIDNNVVFDLYGRDSGDNLNNLKRMIIEKGVKDIVIINGPVFEKEKEDVLKNAYAFIQCSRFEGQPMGIIEAISVGVPCVVTYGTNIGNYINSNNCGLASDFDEDAVFKNIQKIADNVSLRNKMSKNAIKCSQIDFYWKSIINDCVDKYKKIIFIDNKENKK